ncbi:hypothetical protein FIBSPDRAFT_865239 [Athelia psychrophila]|uniref:Uncharacterized protein n=1 Tax=Athelia psychrophila TaxID=1759441 RepID=A0A166FRL9_9AGAM|nr:hypothetical protein FIBSPDRAFT_865239 [Fibularhizoctonia sp. CBS 109695]
MPAVTEWSSTGTYEVGQTVNYVGTKSQIWTAKVAHTSNANSIPNAPNSQYWK